MTHIRKTDRPKILDELEKIASLLPVNIYWLDVNNRILGGNQQALKSVGASSFNEVIGKSLFDIYPLEIAEKIAQHNNEVLVTGKILSQEEDIKDITTGKVKYFNAVKAPLLDDEGNVIGTIGSSINITEQKEAEHQLLEAKEKAETANLAKSAFLATMSHELRTPLNGILGMAQILKSQDMSAEQMEYVNIIERSGKNLLVLVNNILDLSMIESGNLILKQTTFSLREFIDNIIGSCQPLVRKKPVNLIAQYDSKLPKKIIADEMRLRQILLNLIGNATKFTLQGSITLSVKAKKLKANKVEFTFTVSDTGIGIPDDKLETIFERFTQVESSYNRRFEGAGLGLAIAQRLTTMMGGKISVMSKLDKGSDFSVILEMQIADDSIKLTSESSHEKIEFKESKANILLVEDNLINQKIVQAFLKEIGVTIDVAATGKEAITLYEANTYDLVLMDLSLPDGDGITISTLLKDLPNNPNTPIIALTAHVLPEDREKCLAAGMKDILSKPIVKAQLIESVLYWIDKGPAKI